MAGTIDTVGLPKDPNHVSIQGTFTTITNGARTAVPTPGTAVRLTSTTTACKMLMVQALFTNSTNIAVGGSDVLGTAGSEKGIFLEAGASMTIPVNDVSLIYIDAQTANDGVTYQYFV